MTEKIYSWYDSLQDPHRFFIFFFGVMPWIILAGFNDALCKWVGILVVVALLATRITYLYRHNSL